MSLSDWYPGSGVVLDCIDSWSLYPYLLCLPGVSWWLSASSSWCHGDVCGLWLWYFLIIPTYYFWLNFLIIGSVFRIPMIQKHMATELIRGISHFHRILDKPIKLETRHKAPGYVHSLSASQKPPKRRLFFPFYTPFLPLNLRIDVLLRIKPIIEPLQVLPF